VDGDFTDAPVASPPGDGDFMDAPVASPPGAGEFTDAPVVSPPVDDANNEGGDGVSDEDCFTFFVWTYCW
jgi:hypothetical protein